MQMRCRGRRPTDGGSPSRPAGAILVLDDHAPVERPIPVIRLFASDLDGTLLNVTHGVDRTILSSVREVCDQGRHFAIATGRCVRASTYLGFDGLPVSVVCANGSLVYDADGALIHHSLLDRTFLEELLSTFPGLPFAFIATDRTYVTASMDTFQASNTPPNPFVALAMRGMRRGRGSGPAGEFVFDASATEVLSHQICKANIRTSDAGTRRQLESFLAAHADTVTNAPFRPSLFEITSRGVDKGVAVAWLADYLGVPHDEVAVYGDGGNDVAMLSRFAHAYVTSCATEDARAAATASVGSNALHAVPRHMLRTLGEDMGRTS